MNKSCLAAWLIFISLVVSNATTAQDVVDVSTTWSQDAAKPGEQVVLAVSIFVKDGYHIGNELDQIQEDKREEVMPSSLVVKSTSAIDHISIGLADFPRSAPDSSELVGAATLFVPIDLDKLIDPGTYSFQLEFAYQACDDKSCFPPKTAKQTVKLNVVGSDSVRKGCPDPSLFARWSDRRSKKPSDKKTGSDYKSKQPPIGPPWVRELTTAQALALKTGRPIFLYSTKTFCPHCVIVESEMLSSSKLKPYYEKAIWLYVYRDFSGSDADRLAQRIGDRYSLSSWPQLWLIDPNNLSVVSEIGRSVDSFAQTVDQVKYEPKMDPALLEPLAQSEASLIAFDKSPSKENAAELIKSDDIVAKIAAVRYFAANDAWQTISRNADSLLPIANDGLRYEVLKAISKTGQGDQAKTIQAIVDNPAPSRNPNVLRSHAIEALAACGSEDCIDSIATHASGTARNMTTRVAVNALVRLAARHPKAKGRVAKILAKSFPPCEERVKRIVEQQARLVHTHLESLTDKKIEFPSEYDETTRDSLIQRWQDVTN
ncbi:MAG: hypothetical protein AAFN77_08330 [Planctomycetota bacterium]